jgi:hypothetical protein
LNLYQHHDHFAGPGIAAEDQGRVIAGILEDPAAHQGKIYPERNV